jgi:hypothetical protein
LKEMDSIQHSIEHFQFFLIEKIGYLILQLP